MKSLFIKRIIAQGIILLGIIAAGVLIIAGKSVDVACSIGGAISLCGLVYGWIKLRCPFCHSKIPIRGFFIDHCPECGEKL